MQECGEESPTPPLSHLESGKEQTSRQWWKSMWQGLHEEQFVSSYPVSSFTLSGYGTWVLRLTGATHKGHSWKPPSKADFQIWTLLQKILPRVTAPISVPLVSHVCPEPKSWPPSCPPSPGALHDALMQLSSEYRLISWRFWRHAEKTGDSVSHTNEGTGEVIHLQTESWLGWGQVRLELEGELITVQKHAESCWGPLYGGNAERD